MTSPFTQFTRGIRAELPILVGVIPFGMIYGVLALEAGLTRTQAQAMSAIVFAGSAQMIATQLIHLGVPGIVMILTIGVVNLRHALYSASLAPYLKHLTPAWKWLLSYLLTDEAFAVTIIYYQNTDRELLETISHPALTDTAEGNIRLNALDPSPFAGIDLRHWFFLGAGLALWVSWQLSTALGIFLGALVPESWSLDFTLALTFIALVVPNLKDWALVVSAVTAGVTALVVQSAPHKLGLIIAACFGIFCGWLTERIK